MMKFEGVRALALALPGTEEGTSYGTPAFKVKGKLFVRLREDGALVLVLGAIGDREALMAEDPETFYITPHYENYPSVLINLDRIDKKYMAELLEESWRARAPKKLVAAFDADGGSPV
jgi:hypothetical protein